LVLRGIIWCRLVQVAQEFGDSLEHVSGGVEVAELLS